MDKEIKIKVSDWEIHSQEKNKRLIRFSFEKEYTYTFYVEKRSGLIFKKWEKVTFGAYGEYHTGITYFNDYPTIFKLYDKL